MHDIEQVLREQNNRFDRLSGAGNRIEKIDPWLAALLARRNNLNATRRGSNATSTR